MTSEKRCGWCDAAEGLVLVGVVERASGPCVVQYACGRCQERYGILRLDEHPAGSFGGVLYGNRKRAVREQTDLLDQTARYLHARADGEQPGRGVPVRAGTKQRRRPARDAEGTRGTVVVVLGVVAWPWP